MDESIAVLEIRISQIEKRQDEMEKTYKLLLDKIDAVNNRILAFFMTLFGAIIISAVMYIINTLTK